MNIAISYPWNIVDIDDSKKPVIKEAQHHHASKGTTDSTFTEVFVMGLDPTVTRLNLNARFGQYGKIVTSYVPQDPASGRSRGFGFVTFYKHTDALKAVNSANGTMLKGLTMTVSPSRKKSAQKVSSAAGTTQAQKDTRQKATKQAKAPAATQQQLKRGPKPLPNQTGAPARKGKAKRVFEDFSLV